MWTHPYSPLYCIDLLYKTVYYLAANHTFRLKHKYTRVILPHINIIRSIHIKPMTSSQRYCHIYIYIYIYIYIFIYLYWILNNDWQRIDAASKKIWNKIHCHILLSIFSQWFPQIDVGLYIGYAIAWTSHVYNWRQTQLQQHSCVLDGRAIATISTQLFQSAVPRNPFSIIV